MRITIDVDIPHVGENVEEYYRSIASRIGVHIAELVSLGNMDEAIVSGICKCIAKAIDSGILRMREISTVKGAEVVKSGFLDAVGEANDRREEIIISPESGSKRKKTARAVVSDLWEDLSRVRSLNRIDKTLEKLQEEISRANDPGKAVERIEEVCSALNASLPRALNDIDRIATKHGVFVCDDKMSFLENNEGYIDGGQAWRVPYDSEEKVVVAISDILRDRRHLHYYLPRVIDKLIVHGDADLLSKACAAIEGAPEVFFSSVKDKAEKSKCAASELSELKRWIADSLGGGVARGTIQQKIQDDFSSLRDCSHGLLQRIEFMFPGREVVRKQRSGRLTFFWKH